MEIIKNFSSGIEKIFKEKKNKNIFLIIFLGIIGIMFILISEVAPKSESDLEYSESSFSTELSKREELLEKKITEAVSKIKGAGKTHVTITFESSEEYIFAKNSSENKSEKENEKESELVIIDGEKGDQPVRIKTNEAKIRGVLIICEGGKNSLVKEKIIEGVCALLDIPSNKVSVAEMAE